MAPSPAGASASTGALRPAGGWPASGGFGGAVGAVFSPTCTRPASGGSVADGGCAARLGAAAVADGDARRGADGRRRRFEPPCERRAAERVMSRDPQPGQVTMLSGAESGPTGVLQRGQFMSQRLGRWTARPKVRV